MIIQDNTDYCVVNRPNLTETTEQCKIVSYGDVSNSIASSTFLQGGTMVNSLAIPFEFTSMFSKGSMPFVTYGTSTEINLGVSDTAWFLNDKFNRVIVFPTTKWPLGEMTGACSPRIEVTQTESIKQLVQVLKKIGKFARFAENWDSYGAKAITEDCIIQSLDIIKELINLKFSAKYNVPVPFVAPLSSGGIQIEWEKDERYLEISITSNPTIVDYFAADKAKSGQLSLEGPLQSISFLKELLTWFVNGTAEDLPQLSFEIGYEEWAF